MSNDLEHEREEISVEEQPETVTVIETTEMGAEETTSPNPRNRAAWLSTLAVIALFGILGLWWISVKRSSPTDPDDAAAKKTTEAANEPAKSDEPEVPVAK